MSYIKIADRLKRGIYGLIVARLDGEALNDRGYKAYITGLVNKGIGGLILFNCKWDVIVQFLKEIDHLREEPIIIASDIERGVGQQIEGATWFPPQMAIAAAFDTKREEDLCLLKGVIEAMASEAKACGINMPLIPVLDVNQNPENPIICTRAFSDDPEVVSEFGSLYIRHIEEMGLLSCAKHFPGHGSTDIDSHLALPVVLRSKDALRAIDLYPFITAIKAGVSTIMTGHLTLPSIDVQPASLSKILITELLKRELGFKGIVITDALNMAAIRDIEDAAIKAVKAGAGLLLHPSDPDETVEGFIMGLEKGRITLDIIESAIKEVERAKQEVADKRKRQRKGQPYHLISTIDYDSHRELSQKVSERSITLIKNTKGALPINQATPTSLVVGGDWQAYDITHLENRFSPIYPLYKGKDRLIPEGHVIFAIFTTISAWKGLSGITDEETNMVKQLILQTKRSIVISFGSPYILEDFVEADGLVAAYDPSPQTQEAVIRCLYGHIPFSGRLPVRLRLSGIEWNDR